MSRRFFTRRVATPAAAWLAAACCAGSAIADCDDPFSTWTGNAANDWFGLAVSAAGDVDGDGFADVLVGAHGTDVNGTQSGSASVFSGASGAALYTWHGEHALDAFGHRIGPAGDVNGDGFGDVVIGAPGADANGEDSGSIYVFSGATGELLHLWHGEAPGDILGVARSGGDVDGDGFDDIVAGAERADINGDASGSVYVFSGATGARLYTWHGDSAGDRFGQAVDNAGDVNGDGFADVIVTAPLDDAAGEDSGSAYVFSGADGALLYVWHGENAGDRFGYGARGAGDVDADGRDDLIVGAFLADANGEWSGSAYVFSGATGDVLYLWHGDSERDHFGQSVAAAGDVNGDGFADLVVGAWADDANDDGSGSAFVFSGATGMLLATIHGEHAGDGLGCSVDGLGDATGDGLSDVVIGAFGRDANGIDAGSAFAFTFECGFRAMLTDLTAFGDIVSGGIDEIRDSDGRDLEVRSRPGFNATEPAIVNLTIGAASPLEHPLTIDLTYEGRISQPGGFVHVELKNWSTGRFEEVGSFGIGWAESVQVIEDIAGETYVRNEDARIEARYRIIVASLFQIAGFTSFTDEIVIRVKD